MGLSEPLVYVLRIGHRPARDRRLTTHVALAARALGASGFILAGECDASPLRSLLKVEKLWGRGLDLIACGLGWRDYVDLWKRMGWLVVHLTMYGLPLLDVVEELRRARRPILAVVGSEKVPQELFELADYNVSVTSQPHSEVSALALFLDAIYNRAELEYRTLEGARLIVQPSARGKKVTST
ncbi:MAG: tRNA (cytidine(56)-2'-O)-methyltransferase [Fervidicoccaceae archaeon]